ncbi:MAG: hypothetical protein OHK0017_12940 [Patescibacteria group bacterium]
MPKLIIISGPMGSGKSTTAKLLAQQLTEPNYYLQMDNLKWSLHGLNEDLKKTYQLVYEISYSIIDTCLKNNVSVIVEKVVNAEEFKHLISIGDKYEVEVLPVLLKIELQNTIQRVTQRRQKDSLDTTLDYLDKVNKSFTVTQKLFNLDPRQLIIDSYSATTSEIVAEIINNLKTN